MTTFGLNNLKESKLYDKDIIRKDGETKEQWISRMNKWSGQYRREYGKLYYRIFVKQVYKKEDLDLYIVMTNKPSGQRVNCNDTSRPKRIVRKNNFQKGLKIENKHIRIDFS